MRRLGKFAALVRSERMLLVRGWIEVLVMRVATWTLPYRKVKEMVERRATRPARDIDDKPDRDRIAWAIAVSSGYIPGGTNCLVRALATEVMLGRFGYDSELRFGVARAADGRLRAHAWLESAGRPIIGDFELDRYVTLSAPQVDKL